MLAHFEQQLRSRAVLEISNSSTRKRELGILQLRKVEGERKFSGEPRLYRMFVRRYYVYRVGAGQVGHM